MAAFEDYVKANPGSGDAWARLEAILRDYNLQSLIPFVKEQIISGQSEAVVAQNLTATNEYRTRFSVIEERRKQGLPPISATDVINYERQATQLMRSAGLPQGFWDSPDDFKNLMLKDISVAELQNRITDGYVKASQAPKEVVDQLYRYGGLKGPGDLAAYYLDPAKAEPVLQRQFAMAQASGSAVRTGYGALSETEAERLAALRVSEQQAQAGFSELANSQELFTDIAGESSGAIGRDQQLGAAFGGDTKAQEAIERKRGQRKSSFGGGSFAGGQKGLVGLGSADSA